MVLVVPSLFVCFLECILTDRKASTKRTSEAVGLPKHTAKCSGVGSAKTGHNIAGAEHCPSQRHRQATGTTISTTAKTMSV